MGAGTQTFWSELLTDGLDLASTVMVCAASVGVTSLGSPEADSLHQGTAEGNLRRSFLCAEPHRRRLQAQILPGDRMFQAKPPYLEPEAELHSKDWEPQISQIPQIHHVPASRMEFRWPGDGLAL